MTETLKIAFIGGGNMGEAMLSAILSRKLYQPKDVTVSDISRERRQFLEQRYGVTVTSDNSQAVDKADVIILAIKPQNLANVIADLSGKLNPSQLVLSIMAGVKLDTIRQGLKHNVIVRAMPNTPARISQGMTVWTAFTEVNDEQKTQAAAILGAIGQEIYVDDEQFIDMATAISGSGPAYFFLFIEELVNAAINIGLPRETAEELALQTMIGSGNLIRESGKSPSELREMVTSRGGTTAAAIDELAKGEFGRLIIQAVRAAHRRAQEMGNEQS